MSDSTPAYPSEEYIAGREHGRIAGLKQTRKVRARRVVAGTVLGGAFAALMISSPATTGRTGFAPLIALSIFGGFVVLGFLGLIKTMHSYRRDMRHLREDIIRSVVSPDDVEPEPGRLRKWWLRSDASGEHPWETAATDGANDFHRKF
jgi:hypothetical protein